MRRSILAAALMGLALAFANAAGACEFDTDCEAGSSCRKSFGKIDGVCVGGIRPGNENDKKPSVDPLDPHQTVGNTCQLDSDCGPGTRCLKSAGSLHGTCMR